MKKFMVVSGFLGAGKTTFMLALADYICKGAWRNEKIYGCKWIFRSG